MQNVEKAAVVRRIVKHVVSAHDEAELATLLGAGRDKLVATGQEMLDACAQTMRKPAAVQNQRSRVLLDAITTA